MHTTKYLPAHHSTSEIPNHVKPDLLIYDMFQPWLWGPPSSRRRKKYMLLRAQHQFRTVGPDSPYPQQALYQHDEEFSSGNFKMSTDIVLVKSSWVVEDKYIDYLSILSKKRVVPTGPLIVHHHREETWEIMKWLSEKSRRSTVYISFGSECFLSKEELAEIAIALLQLSEVNFLWIIRFPIVMAGDKKSASIEEALPVGFLETVKERGRVIEKWAPQAKILDHPSVGGFVSHCRWSSMESMYIGVPVIGMPMKVEQPINARLSVEVGVGVEVEKDTNGKYVGDEVAKAINKAMGSGNDLFYEGLRDNARRLSQKMKEHEENEANETAEQLLKTCMKKKKKKTHQI